MAARYKPRTAECRRTTLANMLSAFRCLPWLLSLLLMNAASAMSLREMRSLEQADPRGATYIQYYLIGVMEGALEADAMAQRMGRKPLYCLHGRRPDPRMAMPLFQAELRRNEGIYEADMPVELVMANALAAAYRCIE